MTPATILVADDDRSIRTVLARALGQAGHVVKCASNAATLWRWVANGEGDMVITDVVMPDDSGLDLLPRIKRLRPSLPIVVMSAQTTLLTAIRAAERGAYEYLPKPFDLSELLGIVQRALTPAPRPEHETGVPAADARDVEEDSLPLIGVSQAMQDAYRVLARLMNTDLTVMISGESGTGKELFARALHDYGRRKDGPFVAVNMAAIPRELIESELFGHERGAFTGAATRTAGRFEQANGGTLFLDEIGDMPLEAQTRLLRVLQEGEFTSVGGRTPIRTNVRIVAATHRDLRSHIEQGLFREDLFYRLNVVPLRLPPLRERREDIPLLVRHFLDRSAAEGLAQKSFSGDSMDRLCAYGWPGNVRELENLIRRITVLHTEEIIDVDIVDRELTVAAKNPTGNDDRPRADESLSDSIDRHLAQYFANHKDDLPAAGLYDRILQEVERPLIEHTLTATRGNQIKAAKLLGLNRNTLRKKIRALDIQVVRGAK